MVCASSQHIPSAVGLTESQPRLWSEASYYTRALGLCHPSSPSRAGSLAQVQGEDH